MALHTKSQFAKLCGKSAAHISMAIKRGNIILSGDYIDDQEIKNAIIKKKWQDETGILLGNSENLPIVKSVSEVAQQLISNGKASLKKQPIKEIKAPVKKTLEDQPENSGGIYGLDTIKKQAEIDFKHAQIRKLKIEEAKIRGLNIPTVLVTNVIFLLGHSFMSNYKNGANQLFIELAHKIKLPPEIESEFKGKLIDLINLSHKNSIDQAKMSIKNIIEESSITNDLEEPEDEPTE